MRRLDADAWCSRETGLRAEALLALLIPTRRIAREGRPLWGGGGVGDELRGQAEEKEAVARDEPTKRVCDGPVALCSFLQPSYS